MHLNNLQAHSWLPLGKWPAETGRPPDACPQCSGHRQIAGIGWQPRYQFQYVSLDFFYHLKGLLSIIREILSLQFLLAELDDGVDQATLVRHDGAVAILMPGNNHFYI